MKIINTNCPNCGASFEIDVSGSRIQCPYCDSFFIIDDGVKADKYEEAGYNFEKGRQRAREELEWKNDPQTAAAQEPKKRKTWLWVLGWIFIFPVPLTIIVVRSKKLAVWLKAIIIIAAWILYIAWVGTANQDETRSDGTQQSPTSSYSQTQPAESEA